ncbi:putative uncharacterized protein DDB_G0271982 [Diorhabda carinulata]|uniref:putative uncharacterized protein DDB_G0271982 n=1 Tax=Diorhabda carinulata TaxID=1163345 RepID=UPI0025A29910|nr:putative uncharacterized protein DDB_G0271982 [Diorhabda carinulata]
MDITESDSSDTSGKNDMTGTLSEPVLKYKKSTKRTPKQKKRQETDSEEEEEEEAGQTRPQQETSMTDIMKRTKTLTKTVEQAITRSSPESKGKISFTKKDQLTVREAMTEMQQLVHTLIAVAYDQEVTINRLKTNTDKDKNNDKLDMILNKVNDLESRLNKVSTPTPPQPKVTHQNLPTQPTTRTYASLVAQAPQPQTWNSPPKTPRVFETLVKNDTEDPQRALDIVKKIVKPTDIETIRRTKTGIILINKDKDTQTKIKEKLDNNTNLKTKAMTTQQDPIVLITGVQKGIKAEDLLQDILNENEDLQRQFGNRIKTECKRLGGRPCRNPYKENILLQCPADIFRAIMTKEHIYIDLTKLYTQEHIPVTLCFKCSRYGHSAKYCTDQKYTCYRCGDAHDPKTCTTTDVNCHNCRLLRLPQTRHEARDRNCPIYIKKLNETRRNINY